MLAKFVLSTCFLIGAAASYSLFAGREDQRTTKSADDPGPGMLEYNRDIRPILSNNCFKCHGPDDRSRKGGLRLDVREQAFKATELGDTPIVPGDSAVSELVRRVFSTDPAIVMPRPASNKTLTDSEKRLLKRWID